VKLTKNEKFHKQSKHVEARYYFVHKCYQDGHIGVEQIDGIKQSADFLMKAMDRVQFETLHNDMRVRGY
jgi:hypothetical protein